MKRIKKKKKKPVKNVWISSPDDAPGAVVVLSEKHQVCFAFSDTPSERKTVDLLKSKYAFNFSVTFEGKLKIVLNKINCNVSIYPVQWGRERPVAVETAKASSPPLHLPPPWEPIACSLHPEIPACTQHTHIQNILTLRTPYFNGPL